MHKSKAITKIQAGAIIVIVLVIVIALSYYYSLQTTPTISPSPTPTISPSPTPTISPSPTPTISPSPTPTATPQEVTFTYSWVTDLTGLDPACHWTTDARKVQQFAYEGLLKLKGGTSEIEESLATSWTVSGDGLTYTFRLREGVKFSDGSPFNATAVKKSFERLLGIGMQVANYKMIKEIKILDNYTVEFKLEYPFAPFLAALAMPPSFIINPNALEKHKNPDDPWAKNWFLDHTSGTGPYQLEQWIRGEKWIFQKNPYYWRGWNGKHFTKIVGVVVPEPAVSVMMLERGEIDANYFVPLEDVQRLQTNPNMKVEKYPGYGKYWTFNVMKPPTDDVHVRNAIAYAFDYEQALSLVYGYAKQANSLIFPTHWAYNPNGFMFQRNITRAREELAKSAYPEGGFTIKVIWCAGVDLQRRLNELLKTNLAEININLEIDGKEWATFSKLQTTFETSYHMATFNMMMFLPDPHNDYVRFTTDYLGISNYAWYNKTSYNKLVERGCSETDFATRKNIYFEIQDIIHHRDLACLPIFYEDRFVVFGKWVHGFTGNTFLCETFGNPWFMWIEPGEKI